MAWTNPKTNWTSVDGVTSTDMNRIEGNALELYNTGVTAKATSIAYGTNWDTIITPGTYSVASASAWPAANKGPVGAYGYGQLVVTANGNAVTQQYIPHGVQQGAFYQRSKYNASDWGEWYKFFPETDFNIYRSGKDANGVFTVVQHKRPDNTLAIQSTLSGGTSPQYTTRTIVYYGKDGTTVERTWTRTLSYDADGDLTQEV